jgi:hypothetical protein
MELSPVHHNWRYLYFSYDWPPLFETICFSWNYQR